MRFYLTFTLSLLFIFQVFSQSITEAKQKAEQGDATAQFNLGLMYYAGIETLKDDKQAFYWYKKSAEQGYANAQFFVGLMYYTGTGTLKDYKQAASWIKIAYENGNEAAEAIWNKYELWKY